MKTAFRNNVALMQYDRRIIGDTEEVIKYLDSLLKSRLTTAEYKWLKRRLQYDYTQQNKDCKSIMFWKNVNHSNINVILDLCHLSKVINMKVGRLFGSTEEVIRIYNLTEEEIFEFKLRGE